MPSGIIASFFIKGRRRHFSAAFSLPHAMSKMCFEERERRGLAAAQPASCHCCLSTTTVCSCLFLSVLFIMLYRYRCVIEARADVDEGGRPKFIEGRLKARVQAWSKPSAHKSTWSLQGSKQAMFVASPAAFQPHTHHKASQATSPACQQFEPAPGLRRMFAASAKAWPAACFSPALLKGRRLPSPPASLRHKASHKQPKAVTASPPGGGGGQARPGRKPARPGKASQAPGAKSSRYSAKACPAHMFLLLPRGTKEQPLRQGMSQPMSKPGQM